jgi:hypothetical protein
MTILCHPGRRRVGRIAAFPGVAPIFGYDEAGDWDFVDTFSTTTMDRIMTLKAYTPDRLDEVALRLLDLAGRVRAIAQACRQEGLGHVELHDRKALEHLDRVEEWLYKAEADQKVASVKNQGRQHAKKMQSRQAK